MVPCFRALLRVVISNSTPRYRPAGGQALGGTDQDQGGAAHHGQLGPAAQYVHEVCSFHFILNVFLRSFILSVLDIKCNILLSSGTNIPSLMTIQYLPYLPSHKIDNKIEATSEFDPKGITIFINTLWETLAMTDSLI